MKDIIFGLNPIDLAMIVTLVGTIVEIEVHQFVRNNAANMNKGNESEESISWNFLHE